jgi:hypothetical protein
MDNLLKQHIRTLIYLKIENKLLKNTLKSIQKEREDTISKLKPKSNLISNTINIINIVVFEPAKYALFTIIEFFTRYR